MKFDASDPAPDTIDVSRSCFPMCLFYQHRVLLEACPSILAMESEPQTLILS